MRGYKVFCHDCGKKLTVANAECIERNGNLIHVCSEKCEVETARKDLLSGTRSSLEILDDLFG